MTNACAVPVLHIITKGSRYVFVMVWICIMSRNTSKRGESFGISRIGNKIKGVFKSTTMEGAMLPSYGLAEGEDDMVSEQCLKIIFKKEYVMFTTCLWDCVRKIRYYVWPLETP